MAPKGPTWPQKHELLDVLNQAKAKEPPTREAPIRPTWFKNCIFMMFLLGLVKPRGKRHSWPNST